MKRLPASSGHGAREAVGHVRIAGAFVAGNLWIRTERACQRLRRVAALSAVGNDAIGRDVALDPALERRKDVAIGIGRRTRAASPAVAELGPKPPPQCPIPGTMKRR